MAGGSVAWFFPNAVFDDLQHQSQRRSRSVLPGADPARCIALFRALLARAPGPLTERFEGFLHYAARHQALIDRFGRFPRRNIALGRGSTPEELRYLEDGGDTFSAGGRVCCGGLRRRGA